MPFQNRNSEQAPPLSTSSVSRLVFASPSRTGTGCTCPRITAGLMLRSGLPRPIRRFAEETPDTCLRTVGVLQRLLSCLLLSHLPSSPLGAPVAAVSTAHAAACACDPCFELGRIEGTIGYPVVSSQHLSISVHAPEEALLRAHRLPRARARRPRPPRAEDELDRRLHGMGILSSPPFSSVVGSFIT